MDKYEKIQKVGEGAYGKVYKERDKNSGQNVAVKVASVEHVVTNGTPLLYLVFEYLDTDLKKFIDCDQYSVNGGSLPPKIIQVRVSTVKRNCSLSQPWSDAQGSRGIVGIPHYSTPIDIGSVGCIFGMVINCQRDSEIKQVHDIFRMLGTPTEKMWLGVGSLSDWHEYPQWEPMNLASAVPNLSPSGLDLLAKMLQYDPVRRISAKESLDHPYFDDLDKSQF